jgi:spore maturation protein SpmA
LLNGIFVFVVLGSVLLAAFGGRMEPLLQACIDSARSALDLALGLVGVMAFFLGLMRVATDAGLLRAVATLVAPVLRRLFPGVPSDHPAMGAMILNLASNVLGLGNAATPFGVKAMIELDRLNGAKGTATDAMVLFLAINTSGLAILPTGVIGLRASLGSKDAAGILVPTWIASGFATMVAVAASLLLSRLARYRRSAPGPLVPEGGADGSLVAPESAPDPAPGGPLSPPRFGKLVALSFAAAMAVALALRLARGSESAAAGGLAREVLSFWILPMLIAAIVLYGWVRGVKVYSSLVEGAKEGFSVAIRILPYLVAILVMVGLFRASGGMELLAGVLGRWTEAIALPAEAVPMALLRPLSGSGAYGLLAELLRTHGPDSYIGYLASTLQGSTETTFYVLAVYFGAVGIRKTRHAVPACLLADAAGISAAVAVSALLFGSLR